MIVLDTHAWIWLASDPAKLSVRARRAVEAADSIGVAAISCWEIAMLVARKRLRFDRDVRTWIQQALGFPKLELMPLTPAIAVLATQLEWAHRDPADRMIVATALHHRAGVVTKDERIRSWRAANVIW